MVLHPLLLLRLLPIGPSDVEGLDEDDDDDDPTTDENPFGII